MMFTVLACAMILLNQDPVTYPYNELNNTSWIKHVHQSGNFIGNVHDLYLCIFIYNIVSVFTMPS